MPDMTFSDVERLGAAVGEADEAFSMDEDTFRVFYDRTARSVLLVMFVGAICHVFIRAEYPRPLVLPPFRGLSEAFMHWVQTVDAPGNVFPSLHVAHTFAVAFVLRRDRPRLGTVTLVMAVLLALSTLTTKQHFVLDLVAGFAMALACRSWALRGPKVT